MSEERTAHLHVCACGTEWTCSKPDCHLADECSACEDSLLEEWADANGFTVTQLILEMEDR